MTRPADRPDITKKDILVALEESYGIVSTACKKVGISRETYYVWYRTDPEFAAACDDVQNVTHDKVESMLLTRIGKEDTTAIIFYCKTKMKHRGYSERLEISGSNGEPIQTQTNINFLTNEADVDAVMRLKIQAVKEHKELEYVKVES